MRRFDLTVVGVSLLIGGAVALRGGATGQNRLWQLAAVCVIGLAYAILRRRALTTASWLVAIFALALLIGLLVSVWLLPIMWTLILCAAGSTVLLVGSIAPARPLFEPLDRSERFRMLALAASIAMAGAAVEISLHLGIGLFSVPTQQAMTATPGNSGVGDPYIGHLHRPSRSYEFAGKDFDAFHTIDPLGFRNRWPWPERSDVVAVGDSLTMGLGVGDEQAWPAIVGRGTGAVTVNLGLVGAGPRQYFRVFERFGAKLQPKLVIVGIYAQNDFWDADLFDQWSTEGAGDNYMVWRNFGRPMRYSFSLRHPVATLEGVFRAHAYPLISSSYLYNLVSAMRGGGGAAPEPPKAVEFPDGGRIELMPEDFVSKVKGSDDRGSREFQLVFDALHDLHRLATAQGARVLMVLQPSKEEVYLPMAGESVLDPSALLRRAFDEAGIEYLDLVPVFRARAEAGARLFFEIDTHPNEAGYALIGEQVTAHVRQKAADYGLAAAP